MLFLILQASGIHPPSIPIYIDIKHPNGQFSHSFVLLPFLAMNHPYEIYLMWFTMVLTFATASSKMVLFLACHRAQVVAIHMRYFSFFNFRPFKFWPSAMKCCIGELACCIETSNQHIFCHTSNDFRHLTNDLCFLLLQNKKTQLDSRAWSITPSLN